MNPSTATLDIVSDEAVRRMEASLDVIGAVRRALIAQAEGAVAAAPVLRHRGPEETQGLNVKLAAIATAGLVGGKLGTFWPGNAARGLANHAGTTLLLDPETGFPMALVAARHLNRLRTAAADALAVEALAKPGARVLAVVGAGGQAFFEVRAVAAVRRLTEVRVGVRDPARAAGMAAMLEPLGLPVRALPIAAAVAGADIVVTVTPSRAALVKRDWIAPGTHVSAMGADASGKQELDPALFGVARVFADWPAQAAEIGEAQHAVKAGLLEVEAIVPIGAVLAGTRPGRTADAQITLFDSSGLAAQDLFVAAAALEAARAQGLVQRVAF